MKVLYDTDLVSVILGESLAALRALPDKMFDLVLTDPPYHKRVHDNLGKERRNDGHKPRAELKFPPMDAERILAYAHEYVRLSKGWILSFSDFFYSGVWGEAIRQVGGEWVRTGQWVKTNPMPQMTGDRPACGAEDIVIAHASPFSKDWKWNGKGHAAIWRGPREAKMLHPNQKPEWLLQALLAQFAPKNALVLDPFFGVGSTGAAALHKLRVPKEVPPETYCAKCAQKRVLEYSPEPQTGLRVVGIEGDPEYADLAVTRIQASIATFLAA